MKTLKMSLVMLLIASVLSTMIGAAEFVPSAERGAGVELVEAEVASEKDVAEDEQTKTVVVVPYVAIHLEDILDAEELGLEDDAHEEITEAVRESLLGAVAELEDQMLHHLVPGFDAKWEEVTGGAPLENAVVSDAFEVVLICSEEQAMITDEKITVVLRADGITADDSFLVVHKRTSTGEWVVEDYTIDENNLITMELDELSPFAIVLDSEKAPSTDKDSPQTGVTENTAAAAALAVIMGAGAILCGRKLKKNAQ